MQRIRKRVYVRVPEEQRQQLLSKVFKEGFKIKGAAEYLNIKYPAAKTIIESHRKKLVKKIIPKEGQKSCNYKNIKYCQNIRNLYIQTQIAGEVVSLNHFGQKEIYSCQ